MIVYFIEQIKNTAIYNKINTSVRFTIDSTTDSIAKKEIGKTARNWAIDGAVIGGALLAIPASVVVYQIAKKNEPGSGTAVILGTIFFSAIIAEGIKCGALVGAAAGTLKAILFK